MQIKLNHKLATNRSADAEDARQVKKALNRLGYYAPYEKTGITAIPDARLFAGIKSFQRDNALPATGAIAPGDETEKSLNAVTDKTPEGKYLWRTVEDDKVRDTHAALNRKVVSEEDLKFLDDPNCRCWLEPTKPEGLKQIVISPINDQIPKWDIADFFIHFWTKNGEEISLEKMGYLRDTINLARANLFKILEDQIENEARKIRNGSIGYPTINNYAWLAELGLPFGKGVIRTYTQGSVSQKGNLLIIEATVDYEYDDVFTDILDIREILSKNRYIEKLDDPSLEKLQDAWIKFSDRNGDLYPVLGHWRTRLTGSILLKNSISK